MRTVRFGLGMFCLSAGLTIVALGAGEAPVTTSAPATQGLVKLADIPGLGWGKSGETTFCGALAAATSVVGPKTDYPTLMGHTALAFRLRWYQGAEGSLNRWSPSSPVGEFPEEIERAGKAVGWKLDGIGRMDQKKASMIDQMPRIRKELAAGRPVLGYTSTFDINVIYGYNEEDDILLTRDYFHGDKAAELIPQRLGPLVIYFAERQTPLTTRAAVMEALRVAVDQWDRDGKGEKLKTEPEAQGWYLYGHRAYDQWIADIQDADPEKDDKLFQPSWWTYDCLNDARHAAADYLKAMAPEMPEAARPHLLKAAEIYGGFAKESATPYMKQDAFLGPWTGKKYGDWTAEVRAREVELLKMGRDADEKAIAELKLAAAEK